MTGLMSTGSALRRSAGGGDPWSASGTIDRVDDFWLLVAPDEGATRSMSSWGRELWHAPGRDAYAGETGTKTALSRDSVQRRGGHPTDGSPNCVRTRGLPRGPAVQRRAMGCAMAPSCRSLRCRSIEMSGDSRRHGLGSAFQPRSRSKCGWSYATVGLGRPIATAAPIYRSRKRRHAGVGL
jgi:hypothetical protein